MKWIYRIFTLGILAAALIGPFFINKPDGEPIMNFPTTDNFNPAKLLSSDKPEATGTASFSPSSATVYKWKDAQGQWNYGDQPPSDNPTVSTLQVDTNTNIIQSLKIEPEVPEEEITSVKAKQKLPERLSDGELSFENAVNALDDAKLVRDMMESRNDQLKAIVGDK